jgi:hypothetical protein
MEVKAAISCMMLIEFAAVELRVSVADRSSPSISRLLLDRFGKKVFVWSRADLEACETFFGVLAYPNTFS